MRDLAKVTRCAQDTHVRCFQVTWREQQWFSARQPSCFAWRMSFLAFPPTVEQLQSNNALFCIKKQQGILYLISMDLAVCVVFVSYEHLDSWMRAKTSETAKSPRVGVRPVYDLGIGGDEKIITFPPSHPCPRAICTLLSSRTQDSAINTQLWDFGTRMRILDGSNVARARSSRQIYSIQTF